MVDLFIDKKPRIWPGGLGVPAPPPIEFDAAIRDEHGLTLSWTSSPIENGLFTTDHGIVLPDHVKMDVVVTTHTDTLIPNVQATRHIRLYKKLEAVAERKEPFDLVTSVKIYTGLVFDRIRLPRTQQNTKYYVISCEMHKLEIGTVDVAEVMAEAAQEIALGAQDAGAVAGVAVEGPV